MNASSFFKLLLIVWNMGVSSEQDKISFIFAGNSSNIQLNSDTTNGSSCNKLYRKSLYMLCDRIVVVKCIAFYLINSINNEDNWGRLGARGHQFGQLLPIAKNIMRNPITSSSDEAGKLVDKGS